MTGKKESRAKNQLNLARRAKLEALEQRLREPLPPLPARFAFCSPPASASSSPREASTSRHQSRLLPNFIQHSQGDHSGPHNSESPNGNRLDDRIAILDEDISVLAEIAATGHLSFIRDPKDQASYTRRPHDTMTEPNTGRHALVSRAHVNQHFLYAEFKLCSILSELETILSKRVLLDIQKARCESLLVRVESALITLDTQKEVEWHRQRPVSSNTKQRVINAEMYSAPSGPMHPTLIAIYVAVLTMHIIYHVPRDGTKVLLSGMKSIAESSPALAEIADDIPSDPRTVISQYRLDPVTRPYLCCPSCYSLYPYSTSNEVAIPQTCHRQLDPSRPSACGESLWRTAHIGSKEYQVPVKKFLHQEMGQWIARLLSRPGVEDCLENPHFSTDGILRDIWDGSVLRELKGPDGKPFLLGPKGELRLIFSLSLDGFNPFHNKTAKSSYSSTAVWLVLLNLPPALRYLPHNRYLVCLLPGRSSPSKDQINPVLGVIVDDWLPFFDPGVWISRTAKYVGGRSVRCYVAPLIADQDAARRVSGHADYRKEEFCSRCHLPKREIHNLDCAGWPRRDLEEHIRRAVSWRDATSKEERDSLYQIWGIRWTPMLRLPRWDPIRYTDLEAMHIIILGLIEFHIRHVWRIDARGNDGEGTGVADRFFYPRPSAEDMEKCSRLLNSSDSDVRKKLQRLPKAVLWHACKDRSLRTAGSRFQLTDILLTNTTTRHFQSDATHTQAHSMVLPGGPSQQSETASTTTALSTTTDHHLASSTQGSEDSIAMDIDDEAVDFNAPPGAYGTKDVRGMPRSTDMLQQVSGLSKAIRDGVKFKKLDRDYKGDIFRHLCLDRRLNFTKSKETMYNGLLEWSRKNEGGGTAEAIAPATSKDRVVFGKDTINAVREDMRNCQLPSWVGSVPLEWALLEKSKLSADQWRVIFTVHLPFTLIRLWATDGTTERRRHMLSNALDLVRSVLIINLRELSLDQIEQYAQSIHRYLSTLLDLYKDINLVPNHHAALHMPETLRDFGPVHTHNAPHYERDIHTMQELNTNARSGELEATMMNSSGRSANLKAVLSDNAEVRRHVSKMVETWETVSSRDARGTRQAYLVDPIQPPSILMQDGKESTMPDYIHEMLVAYLNNKHRTTAYTDQGAATLRHIPLSRHYRTTSKVYIRGVRYCTSQSIVGDSHIIFKNSAAKTVAGSIIGIFEHAHEVVDMSGDSPFFPRGMHNPTRPTTSIFLQVMEYARIHDEERMPLHLACKKEGFVGGYLRRDVLENIQLIEASQVVCHFRLLPIAGGNEKVIHVYPLDRLMSMAFMQECEQGLDDDDEEP